MPVERCRVPVEGAVCDVMQGRSADPIALVIGHKDLALGTADDAVGLPKAARECPHRTVARDLQRAAAIGHRRVVPEPVHLALLGIIRPARTTSELTAHGRARIGVARG